MNAPGLAPAPARALREEALSTVAQLALFGCPRSGTTWLGQIFNAHPSVAYRYQPLFSYEFKDWFGRHGLDETSVSAFADALLGARSDFVLQTLRPRKSGLPTHLVWKEVRFHHLMRDLAALEGMRRLVYIHRPAADVINSWYQAPKEFRAGQDIHAEYLHAPSKNTDASEFNGFARWKQSMSMALALHARHPEKFLLVSYERLRCDPHRQVERLFPAVGLAVDPQVSAFIEQSTSRHDDDPYGVFRTHNAPMTLPADIVRAISADAEARALSAQAQALSL